MVILMLVIAGLSGLVAYIAFSEDSPAVGGILVTICAVSLYGAHYFTTPEAKAAEEAREKAARDLAQRERTPHVIREADGCKVYAFKAGESWHYFTRCPNATVTTDRTYQRCTGSGKSRRCEPAVESIVTSPNS